jgi:hypothetical protein
MAALDIYGGGFTNLSYCNILVEQADGKYLNKVKTWKNSKERYRWIAAALLKIEIKMRKVNNFRKLDVMQKTIKEEI